MQLMVKREKHTDLEIRSIDYVVVGANSKFQENVHGTYTLFLILSYVLKSDFKFIGGKWNDHYG